MNRFLPAWLDARNFMHGVLTAVMAAMAVQLWSPSDTYGAGANNGIPTGNWKLIAHYLDEKSLAALLWAVACIGVLGLASHNRQVRLASVVVLGMAHGVMAAFFMAGNPAGVGSILLTAFAIEGAYLAYRRTVEGA